MAVEVKFLTPTAKMPTQGSEEAAGYDLYADIEAEEIIMPHTTVMIGTGLAMAIPNDLWGGIFARSGLATKRGLRPANCTGIIDSDYRGEIKVAIHNDTDKATVISPRERIAQMIFFPRVKAELKEVSDLTETKRGDGGFGSSGTK